MNRQFLNSFQHVNFGRYTDIHRDIKTGKLKEKEVTREDIDNVKKYLLKSECIETVSGNKIIIGTNKSTYTLFYYEGLMVLIVSMNNRTCIGKTETNYYKKVC